MKTNFCSVLQEESDILSFCAFYNSVKVAQTVHVVLYKLFCGNLILKAMILVILIEYIYFQAVLTDAALSLSPSGK